jgi:hypothetical protein
MTDGGLRDPRGYAHSVRMYQHRRLLPRQAPRAPWSKQCSESRQALSGYISVFPRRAAATGAPTNPRVPIQRPDTGDAPVVAGRLGVPLLDPSEYLM